LERSRRINYYYRNPGSGKFSIENVFAAIIGELETRYLIQRFITKSALDLFALLNMPWMRADIHHITGAVHYLALTLPSRNTIITVHDTGHYTNTLKGWKRFVYRYVFWTWPLRRARQVVAISEFTKSEVVRLFSIPAEKIAVINNPLSTRFTRRPSHAGKDRIVLQIGSGAHKNLSSLIDASRGLNVKLLLVRKPDDETRGMLARAGLDHEFRWDLSEEELVSCYDQAYITFFASTYEGFGLPILESMAIGRPVITSDIEPMRSIGGEAAVIVNPSRVDEIRAALEKLLSDSAWYETCVSRGLAHVRQYSARAIANQYDTLYQKILQ